MRRVQVSDLASIHLAFPRAAYALQKAGVWSELRDIAIPIGGRRRIS